MIRYYIAIENMIRYYIAIENIIRYYIALENMIRYYIALENIETYKRSKGNLIEAREPVCNRRYPPPKVKLMKKEEPQTESNLQTNKE